MFARHRALRLKTIVVMVLSLLFSQLALANYLCPVEGPTHAPSMMAPGMPCEEMDTSQPTLCHQHAADPGQVAQPAQIVSPSLPIIIQVLVVPALLDAGETVAVPRASTPEAQPPPDPIFLATLRLRV